MGKHRAFRGPCAVLDLADADRDQRVLVAAAGAGSRTQAATATRHNAAVADALDDQRRDAAIGGHRIGQPAQFADEPHERASQRPALGACIGMALDAPPLTSTEPTVDEVGHAPLGKPMVKVLAKPHGRP